MLSSARRGKHENRQPFAASVFRAVKKKKQRAPSSTQDLARNMRPVSKRGKKYNRSTCEKHVTLVRAGSRTEDKTGSKNVQLVLQNCCKTS